MEVERGVKSCQRYWILFLEEYTDAESEWSQLGSQQDTVYEAQMSVSVVQ